MSRPVIFLICLAHVIVATWASQANIDSLSKCLRVEYEVLSNLETVGSLNGNIFFTNDGCVDLNPSNWSLFFCHVAPLSPDDPDGIDLGDSGLKAVRINGCLYKIEPTVEFNGFPSGVRIQVPFVASGASVTRSDVMPNWFFVDPESEPRTVLSTSAEDLDFVVDFTTPDQWKRSLEDTYAPYTPGQRLDMIDYDSLVVDPSWIMPTPIHQDLDASVRINLASGDWVVFLNDTFLLWEAEYLAMRLDTVVEDPDDKMPTSRYVTLSLGDIMEGETIVTESEAYHIHIQSDEIVVITGNDAAGVFYGIQSLLSLYDTSEEIPTGDVIDYPRFHYRGMHLDVSRNFHGKLEVFKLLESMSMYKLNKFHFHLTDDEGWRLEIPGLPELTGVGAHRCYDPSGRQCIMPQLGSNPGPTNVGSGFYSVQEYKDILEFAHLRHIEVIPEFDMPGHCHAAINAMLARYETYADDDIAIATQYLLSDFNDTSEYVSAQYFRDNAVNPCLESTYAFIDKVIGEVKAMHEDVQPLRAFHFGGDEVAVGAWLDSPACQALMDPDEVEQETLMAGFVLRVADLALGWGLDLAGWEDGLMEGAQPINRTLFGNDNVYGYFWNNVWEQGRGNRVYILANQGFKAILAHATHLYFDHPHEPDPEERGAYWATRVAATRKTFGYMPGDIYQNIDVTGNGDPIDVDELCSLYGCPPLEPDKQDNIIGIQGHLWSERVRNEDQLHSMIFPRLLALAERAWHKALWEDIKNEADREIEKNTDWERFANALGHKELRRLDRLGVAYRVSLPGASLSDDLHLTAKTEYPGSLIQYSVDDGATWRDYTEGEIVPADTDVILQTRSADCARASRQVAVAGKPGPDITGGSLVTSRHYLPLVMLMCIIASVF